MSRKTISTMILLVFLLLFWMGKERRGALVSREVQFKDIRIKELPRTEIFTLDEPAKTWRAVKAHIPGFIPFTPSRKMRNGNWIMGGEEHWYEAAVAISSQNQAR